MSIGILSHEMYVKLVIIINKSYKINIYYYQVTILVQNVFY